MADDFTVFNGVSDNKRELNFPITWLNAAKYAFMFANHTGTNHNLIAFCNHFIDECFIFRKSAIKKEDVFDKGLVGDVMSQPVITCSPTDSIAKIAATMIDRKVSGLPVLESEGELVGLVTSADLLELLKERDVLETGRVLARPYAVHFPAKGA